MLDRYISVKENLRLNLFDDKQLKDHNLNFIKKGLIKYQDYFDHLYDEINPNVSLDLNQRIAILTDEIYNLIIRKRGGFHLSGHRPALERNGYQICLKRKAARYARASKSARTWSRCRSPRTTAGPSRSLTSWNVFLIWKRRLPRPGG